MRTLTPNHSDLPRTERPAAGPREGVNCILCGASGIRGSKRLPQTAVACGECGFVFAHPQPSEAELAAIYDDAYYRPFGYDEKDHSGYRRLRRAWFDRVLTVAESYLTPGKLLDVGSGLGDLLAAARARGWEACGVETNAFAVNEAERAVPGATFHGCLADFHAADGFDLVTCCDTLEHVRDPVGELRRIRAALRPNGWLLIATVNIGGWQARLSGRRWIHFLREHLWYFDRRSLLRLVEGAGFEVVDWRVPRKVFNLRYIAGIFAHHSRSGLCRAAWREIIKSAPQAVLSAHCPGLPEGQLLVARRGILASACK